MRILVAALLGAIVMFVWSAASHMLLPIGEMGMRAPAGQDQAIAALRESATEGAGVYLYPYVAPERMHDQAAMSEFVGKYRTSPYALVVYHPGGNPAMFGMARNLATQFAGSLLGALLLAWLMLRCADTFGGRVLVAAVAALFAWLAISVPYWNWYLFPADMTLGVLLDQLPGWTLAGAAMAWWLGRRPRTRA